MILYIIFLGILKIKKIGMIMTGHLLKVLEEENLV